MTSGTRYAHAPITEAVIDIQCQTGSDVTALNQETLGDAEYPTGNKMVAAQGHMVLGPAANAFATAGTRDLGFIMQSADKLQICQGRINGFTFSRLAEYTSWDKVSHEARRLWDKYRNVAQVKAITRIGLRYINRLDLPLPIANLPTYLRTAPALSPTLPQDLTGYFMQLQFPLPDARSTCLINETIIDPIKPDTVAVVLDIDVFRTMDTPKEQEELWQQLEQLRHEKNHIFEACITDETRRLFQ